MVLRGSNTMLIPGIDQRGLKVETRGDDEQAVIVGYGAVFHRADDAGTEYRLWEDVFERIMPGAFDEIGDVRSFFNHNPDTVLGRTTSGTLALSVDDDGLRYEVTPPQTARHVVESVERGDVTGSSFMFVPTSTTWREEERDGRTVSIREINSVELFEVGPVTFPAYEATSAGTRCAEGTPEYRFVQWHGQYLAEARTDWSTHSERARLNSAEAREQRNQRAAAVLTRQAQHISGE